MILEFQAHDLSCTLRFGISGDCQAKWTTQYMENLCTVNAQVLNTLFSEPEEKPNVALIIPLEIPLGRLKAFVVFHRCILHAHTYTCRPICRYDIW